MTNHTDTSRIADLRFQVSEKMPINHSDLSCLFDRIEALEAENERLRETLAKIAALTRVRETRSHQSEWTQDVARAALGDTQ